MVKFLKRKRYISALSKDQPQTDPRTSDEDRIHIVFQWPQWSNIRKQFFPSNFINLILLHLLSNKKARTGVEAIMKNKLEKAAFSESPKAAIAHKSTHNAQIILCQKEVVIVQANLNNQETLLVSVYCPPNKNMDATLLTLRNIINKYSNQPILILGDFNASLEFGAKETSMKEEVNNTQYPNSRRISINTINWIKLKTKLHNILKDHLDPDQLPASDINYLINHLQDSIFVAISNLKHNAHNSNSKKKKKAIWWTRDLEIKRSKTRALRRLRRKETPASEYRKKKQKKACWSIKKMILHTKKEKFKSFINSISNNSIFGNSYKILSKKKKRHNINKPIINSAGNLSTSIDESHRSILDFHFPWSNNIPAKGTTGQHQSYNFTPLTCAEVEAVISNIKPKKTVGLDGLPGELIKEIYYTNRKWFLHLLNTLLKKGAFPAIWKTARVVLIEKEGKSLEYPSHFRPICILPCWGKILDKIITERLTYHLESTNLLRDNQHGFRKNHSTILALKSILEFHNNSISKKHLTCQMPSTLSSITSSSIRSITLISLHISRQSSIASLQKEERPSTS
ncbi:uncharacterized protein CDAR_617281 [Caerostris darwini]|uniref:Endonuclease/exonuclease/phosphatase domain-containing protein n=1 Tax=Caerostris darwini TaxID=1538125 RepID=A0AAV4NST7_9ARAC|nr:uncharacterized protein CDAR_617281 [Caerostris darwini]